ncbi:NUDIX domain-containing protein [Paenisporosarcina cavernae]|uniref:NUDIX domain-containing protein n=1 Tax=Paenisporosarcina cavernae TaxID=2320858 RepID=A0A385YTP5_9BACL|nr:NUDIX domain-containing protein [Paenisporosarcina cavernae]AYC29914.1 NUDIX domain-containing protein [Paenisporosarcina cavernae]
MFIYHDLEGKKVSLSFQPGNFPIPSRHVLVIASYQGETLFTEHRERGIELPGGKCEDGESLHVAAAREVLEETGAYIEDLEWLAEYLVEADEPFCKTVFTANVKEFHPTFSPMETTGAIVLPLREILHRSNASFHMKDESMKKIIGRVIDGE